MTLILTAICIVVLCLLTVIWIKHTRDRRELELQFPQGNCWRIRCSSRKRKTRSFTVPVPVIKRAESSCVELKACNSCG